MIKGARCCINAISDRYNPTTHRNAEWVSNELRLLSDCTWSHHHLLTEHPRTSDVTKKISAINQISWRHICYCAGRGCYCKPSLGIETTARTASPPPSRQPTPTPSQPPQPLTAPHIPHSTTHPLTNWQGRRKCFKWTKVVEGEMGGKISLKGY